MKQFVVIGAGRFGAALAERLYRMGHEVLVIDENEDTIQRLSNNVTRAVVADATDENVLKSLGLRNFDAAIVSIASNIQSSIIVTLVLKEMGVKKVVSKAQNDLHARVLYKIGADRVVFPERDMGERVAHNLVSTNIIDYIELSEDYSIVELSIPKEWVGKTIVELGLRAKYEINIVGITTINRDDFDVNPDPTLPLDDDVVFVIIGKNDKLNVLEKKV